MQGSYDTNLVILSVLVAAMASYTALDLAGRVTFAERGTAKWWLLGGAVSMGTGIWSMHFIGMLAFRMPIPMTYDPTITFVSMLIAVAVSGFALALVSRQEMSRRSLLMGGAVMGAGICGMHYTGMAAMQVTPPLTYEPVLFTTSVLIAMGASIAALWLAFNLRAETSSRYTTLKMLAAVVMGLAISGMHYTGMAATVFAPHTSAIAEATSPFPNLGDSSLAYSIGAVVLGILCMTVVFAVFDKLQRAEGRLRSIVESALDAAVVMNDRGEVSGWNPQAERIFGWSNAEAVGRKLHELIVPERYRNEHVSGLQRYLETGEGQMMNRRIELCALRRDGEEFPIELSIAPLRTGPHIEFSAFIRDITERQRAESELKRLNRSLETQVTETRQALDQLRDAQAQLIQSERLASLGGLVAGIAHEINTPVGIGVTAASTLQSRAEELRQRYDGGDPSREDLDRFLKTAGESTDIILRNLRRAADLINSFKQVAVDQSSGERRRLMLAEYINEVLLSLAPKTRKAGHRIVVECPADLEIDSYPGALAQVFTNLVSNSLLHAFPDERKGELRIAVTEDDGWVTIDYSDDGAGIPPAHIKQIYDPFFTTRKGSGGTGLGLHIVFNLVNQLLDGTIEASSEPDRGSRFTIRFPRISRKDPLPQAASPRAADQF